MSQISNGIFNIAKGKFRYYMELPAASDGIVVILLKDAGLEADSTLADYDTVAALLASTNDEADFTNYSPRKVVTAGITITVNDSNNRVDVDFPDQTWTAAGGTTNNTLGKLITAYDPTGSGTDSDLIPISYHDFSATTDGNDLVAQVATAGLLRAA